MSTRTKTKHPGISKYETRLGTRYRVVVDGEIGADGRRRQLTRSGIETFAEAKRVRAELLAEGGKVAPEKVTLHAFRLRWIAAIEPTVRPGTAVRYETMLAHHVEPVFGERAIASITAPEIETWKQGMIERGFSGATVRLVLVVWGRMMSYAVRWGLRSDNPIRVIDIPTANKDAGKVWTADQAKAFLKATRDESYGPLWALLLSTSLRVGEALALTWGCVDLDSGVIQVVQTVTRDRSHNYTIGEPKTKKGRRVVSLGPVGLAGLRRLTPGPPWAYVFAGEAGDTFLRPSAVQYAFVKACRVHGAPKIRLHDLRHTAISLAIEAGVPVKAVADRAGHASIAFTLDRYTHLSTASDQAAANVLGGLLGDDVTSA